VCDAVVAVVADVVLLSAVDLVVPFAAGIILVVVVVIVAGSAVVELDSRRV